MPTASERVPNKPLSGAEVRKLILADFQRLLDNEGALTDYTAYGRISWDISLKLHFDNFVAPIADSRIASRPMPVQQVRDNPSLRSVDVAPLPNPSPEAGAVSSTLSRKVDSPNVERIREGLPVPVEVRQADHTVTTELIQYPSDPTMGEGNVTLTDTSAETQREWGVLDKPQDVKLPDEDEQEGEPSNMLDRFRRRIGR